MIEMQTDIPKLRFPQFKDSWVNDKMGNLFSFKVTNSFSRENLNYEKGTVKNIHYGDIHTKFQTLFDVTKESVPFINPEISIERIAEDNYCQEGDLILADASEDLADVGKSMELLNLNNEKILSGLHTILARPTSEKFSIGFAGYFFKSNNIRTQIQKESQGSKVLSISSTRLSKISLVIPSKEEQRNIVKFFIAIEEKLHALKKKKSLLEEYKKGIMQKLFSQVLRFKDENGMDFPEWEEKKITDIASTSIGLVTTMTTSYVEVGVPLIRNSDIKENRINKTQLIYLDEAFAFKHKQKKLQLNDIVTVHTGDIGVSAVIDESMVGCLGFATINTRVNTVYVLPEYICMYYNTPQSINYAISVATGDGRSNYNLKDFDNAMIPVPSLQEQKKISHFLLSIYQKMGNLEVQIKQIEIWKQGLLQKMFC